MDTKRVLTASGRCRVGRAAWGYSECERLHDSWSLDGIGTDDLACTAEMRLVLTTLTRLPREPSRYVPGQSLGTVFAEIAVLDGELLLLRHTEPDGKDSIWRALGGIEVIRHVPCLAVDLANFEEPEAEASDGSGLL